MLDDGQFDSHHLSVFTNQARPNPLFPAPPVYGPLAQLTGAELVRASGEADPAYTFSHGLIQEAAYATLLKNARRRLHREVGEVIEQVFADSLDEHAVSLAVHFAQAGDFVRAAAYSLRAGDAAHRLHAYGEARLHYQAALQALQQLPDDDARRRLYVDATINYIHVGYMAEGPDRSLARLAEAETLAQSLPGENGAPGGDRLRLARVHFWMGRMHHFRNALPQASAYLDEVVRLAPALGDPELAALPAFVNGQVQFAQGRFDRAEALLASAVAPLERLDSLQEWIMNAGYLGMSQTMRGRYAEGAAHAARALERATAIQFQVGIRMSHIFLALIHLVGGNPEQSLAESQKVGDLAARSGERVSLYVAYGLRAWAEGRAGQPAGAQQSMSRSSDLAARIGGQLLLANLFASVRAEIALLSGQVDTALLQARDSANAARSMDDRFAAGLGERVWGLALAQTASHSWGDVIAHLTASLTLFDQGDARLEAARTHAAWGRLMQWRGDRIAARAHLESALRQFTASGAIAESQATQAALLG